MAKMDGPPKKGCTDSRGPWELDVGELLGANTPACTEVKVDLPETGWDGVTGNCHSTLRGRSCLVRICIQTDCWHADQRQLCVKITWANQQQENQRYSC